MRTIQAGNLPLMIGRRGENLALRVIFPVAKWVEVYGNGQFQLIHRRAGDSAPYPVAVTVDGGNVLWDVTSADTAVVGTGACELQYYAGDVLAKSRTWETRVLPALDDAGPVPPEPEQSWVEQVLDAASRAEDSLDKQPYPNPNTGTWWRWNSETEQFEDTGEPYSGGGGGGVPPGGTEGQYLRKNSATEGDAGWSDLPTFEGVYEVVPRPFGETTMETRKHYLDRDIVVRAIPYQETSNLSGGKTATIGG